MYPSVGDAVHMVGGFQIRSTSLLHNRSREASFLSEGAAKALAINLKGAWMSIRR